MPGDKISAEVYAKYLDADRTHWSSALTNTIIALSGSPNPNGTYVDGGAMGNISSPFPLAGMLQKSEDPTPGPKAYLNYILLDRNFQYIDGGLCG